MLRRRTPASTRITILFRFRAESAVTGPKKSAREGL
jgi:hypothetical protein